jgi:hypothetical protein
MTRNGKMGLASQRDHGLGVRTKILLVYSIVAGLCFVVRFSANEAPVQPRLQIAKTQPNERKSAAISDVSAGRKFVPSADRDYQRLIEKIKRQLPTGKAVNGTVISWD